MPLIENGPVMGNGQMTLSTDIVGGAGMSR